MSFRERRFDKFGATAKPIPSKEPTPSPIRLPDKSVNTMPNTSPILKSPIRSNMPHHLFFIDEIITTER